MKIYEIYQLGVERQFLKELQTSAIDKDLEQTAAGIGASTAARQGGGTPDWNAMAGVDGAGMDGTGMGDAGMGMGMDTGLPQAAGQPGLEPDPSMVAGDGLDGAEELETKKIDSVILSQVQGMDYMDYKHGNSKVSPEKILHMEIDELSQLRNSLLNIINMKIAKDKIGQYADKEMEWYQNMRDFVDKVLDLKKRQDRPVKKKRQGKNAKWEQRPDSKNSKSKQYRKPPKAKGAS